ncbi:MAG: hypothetical protein RL113_1131 [Pseudomonadota bacterium]|jgi:rhodanese-related sulfurtransferase
MFSVKLSLLCALTTLLSYAGPKGFEYDGVVVTNINAKGKTQQFTVKRHIPEVCQKLPINNELVWTGNYAHKEVPQACKSTYVHTTGKLLPMFLHEDISTYGELEVLAFLKEMQTNKKLLLIDGREEEWFEYRTIPGSINIPFSHFKYPDLYELDFEHDLEYLGIKINKDETFDFTHAKTITIFCNGPWCSQSVWMIESLLEIGYPPEKMNWYRGGMQDWLSAGMTSTREN